VFARSFARIHAANLVNFGILPLVLGEVADDALAEGDEWRIPRVREQLASGGPLRVENLTQGKSFEVRHSLTPRQVQVLLAGGLLNYLRDA